VRIVGNAFFASYSIGLRDGSLLVNSCFGVRAVRPSWRSSARASRWCCSFAAAEDASSPAAPLLGMLCGAIVHFLFRRPAGSTVAAPTAPPRA
jgi:hypothetical protein